MLVQKSKCQSLLAIFFPASDRELIKSTVCLPIPNCNQGMRTRKLLPSIRPNSRPDQLHKSQAHIVRERWDKNLCRWGLFFSITYLTRRRKIASVNRRGEKTRRCKKFFMGYKLDLRAFLISSPPLKKKKTIYGESKIKGGIINWAKTKTTIKCPFHSSSVPFPLSQSLSLPNLSCLKDKLSALKRFPPLRWDKTTWSDKIDCTSIVPHLSR